jgi:acetyl esterase/lipase
VVALVAPACADRSGPAKGAGGAGEPTTLGAGGAGGHDAAGLDAGSPPDAAPDAPGAVDAGALPSDAGASDAGAPSDGGGVADAGPGPANAELTLTLVSSRDVADCFPALGRGPLLERAFSYKHVFAQPIDGVARAVHLRAYVFTPPGFAPGSSPGLPAIAMFHGGGWELGSPVLWVPAARYFAARGLTAVVVQYRLGALHDATPLQSTSDALSAVRWLRAHAPAIGVDPARVVTVGDSAGGHLSLAAATIDAIPGEDDGAAAVASRPELAMALYPVSHVGGKALAAIDPFGHLDASAVPTLLLHGTADELAVTPYADSVAYCAKQASVSKAPCTVAPFEGQKHNFLPDPTLYSSSVAYLDSFLVQHGWVGGVLADVPAYAFGAADHCRFSYAQHAALEAEYQLPSSGDGPVF